ncbi:hypothetical protein BTO04_04000 [Polaribacter sp. SA4-10]|uniref:DUF6438 domain-containing protein n=1 Tax=Polaribacter sp. SA4-10 TaxID=754397 RepID=UPI000B3BDDCE|nr:DUF6438 domain-containing protein [Polaribacter sp. SA4-10]ARV05912.1 hypothetical protein BTO04_04000 [Polaribacter sp. SA4-10]
MKLFLLFFFVLALSCNLPKQKIEKQLQEKEVKKEIIKEVKKLYQELFIVLKNPKNVIDAKSLIENSGLIWNELVINDQYFKAATINVPIDKEDFWLQRLKESNVFSTVEISSNEALEKAKYLIENTLVKLRKTHCYRNCSVYDITFFKDGKVIFNGIENVPTKGKHEFTLTEKQLKKVERLFSQTSFNTYSDAFIDKTIADLPSTFITYKKKQVEIKIWKNVPDELIYAYKYLEEILIKKELIL